MSPEVLPPVRPHAPVNLTATAIRIESMLLAAADVAQLLAASIKTVRRLDLSGQIPRPVRLGRLVRWRRDEILAWIEASCPDRDSWTWRPTSPDRT